MRVLNAPQTAVPANQRRVTSMYSCSSLDTASAPNEALTCERRLREDVREARACCNYLMISRLLPCRPTRRGTARV